MQIDPQLTYLLADIDDFLDRSGMTRTAFGIAAVNDPNLYRLVRTGHNLTIRRIARVRAFMRQREGVAA